MKVKGDQPKYLEIMAETNVEKHAQEAGESTMVK